MENKKDNVNKPSHYQLDCGIESIKIIETVLGTRGFISFCLGNVLKYLIRAEKKNKLEDYKKASKYLEWIIGNPLACDFEIVQTLNTETLGSSLDVKWEDIISGVSGN